MFDHMTSKCRDALDAARNSARRFGHESMGPEHMALGLLSVSNSAGMRILTALAIDTDALRAEIEVALERNVSPASTGLLPFTPPAKKVLEAALRESHELGRGFIGTGHLLLGLVVESESIPGRLFAARGLDALSVHAVLESDSSEGDDVRPPIDTTGWRKEALMRAVLVLRSTRHDRLAAEVERAANDLTSS